MRSNPFRHDLIDIGSRVVQGKTAGYETGGTTMLKLKACPRCRGDLHTNRDLYGDYSHCLQCGYMRDIPDPNRLFASVNLAAIRKRDKVA